jgi:hypothetical protein
MKTLSVTIKRSKHGFGKKGGSLLDRNTGLMCCLGFVAKKIGLTDDEIRGIAVPSDPDISKKFVAHPVAGKLIDRFGGSSTVCTMLIGTNDDVGQRMSRARREARLTKEAAKIGLKFRFVD